MKKTAIVNTKEKVKEALEVNYLKGFYLVDLKDKTVVELCDVPFGVISNICTATDEAVNERYVMLKQAEVRVTKEEIK